MPEGPRISLVTPTFNQAATIRETIDSVLGQVYPDLEYHVIDGGSRDGTVEILRSYENDPRFYWVSEPDRGQSDAINKGLARSTGEIFNWINSDDYLEPGALQIVAETFRQNPQLDLVAGYTAEFRGRPPGIFNRIRLPLRANAETTITVGIFCQPSTFWRTEIFRALGGVDPALHYVMDWHLWIRYLARHGQEKVRLIEPLLAHYRHHADAKTSAASEKFYEEAAAIFHEILEACDAPADLLALDAPVAIKRVTSLPFFFRPEFSRERYFGAYAERMVRVHRRKHPEIARKWLKQAMARAPWATPWRLKMAARLLFR